MNVVADQIDSQLLGLLQTAIPVEERPFAALGNSLGIDEADVIARIQRLKTDKVIRQISAIFDTKSLGYASSLVAARIDPSRVDAAAAIINQHPGVSHNYLRNHTFNLWYTLAVSPLSKLGLDKTVEILHRESGAESTRLLPTLRLFKIGVKFDLGGESKPEDADTPSYTDKNRSGAPGPVTKGEVAFVRIMQRDLPVTEAPFVAYAAELGVSLEELQAMHTRFLETGQMRRFAAVLHHRKAGFSANAMGVWAVKGDDAAIERMGETMAGFRAVSHCYRRPSYPDWPFNIFTMIHGKSREDCEATLAAISEKTGIREYGALYSSKEYKKVRVRYFTPDEAAWENSQ